METGNLLWMEQSRNQLWQILYVSHGQIKVKHRFYMALGPWSPFSHRRNGQIFFYLRLYASWSKLLFWMKHLQQEFFTASVQHGCKTVQLKGSITLIRYHAVTAPMKPQMEEMWFVSSTGGKTPTTVGDWNQLSLTQNLKNKSPVSPTDQWARMWWDITFFVFFLWVLLRTLHRNKRCHINTSKHWLVCDISFNIPTDAYNDLIACAAVLWVLLSVPRWCKVWPTVSVQVVSY